MQQLESKTRVLDSLEVPIEYLLTGPADAPVVVFLHSLGASCRQYFLHVDAFAKTHRVLCISMRGHGRSGRPAPSRDAYSLARFARDVIDLTHALGIERFHYVGNSMGGVVGYEIARQRPELLLSLATFGSPVHMGLPGWAVRGYGKVSGLALRALGPDRFRSIAVSNACATEQGRARVREVLANEPGLGVMEHALAALERIDYREVVERADFPVLVMRAEADFVFNRLLISLFEIAKRNPRVRIEPLAGAGHVANLDAPEVFERTLQRFLG